MEENIQPLENSTNLPYVPPPPIFEQDVLDNSTLQEQGEWPIDYIFDLDMHVATGELFFYVSFFPYKLVVSNTVKPVYNSHPFGCVYTGFGGVGTKYRYFYISFK